MADKVFDISGRANDAKEAYHAIKDAWKAADNADADQAYGKALEGAYKAAKTFADPVTRLKASAAEAVWHAATSNNIDKAQEKALEITRDIALREASGYTEQ